MLIAVQYHSPTEIAGVSLYGPTAKESDCIKAAAAYLSQVPAYMPKTDRAAATCLHVVLVGAAVHGQTIVQPFAGQALAWAIVPIEYDAHGKYLGMGNRDSQAIPGGADAATCKVRADDIRTSSYAEGKVPNGNTLLVYCVGLPAIPASVFAAPGDSVVFKDPCPYYPFPGAGACEIATKL